MYIYIYYICNICLYRTKQTPKTFFVAGDDTRNVLT